MSGPYYIYAWYAAPKGLLYIKTLEIVDSSRCSIKQTIVKDSGLIDSIGMALFLAFMSIAFNWHHTYRNILTDAEPKQDCSISRQQLYRVWTHPFEGVQCIKFIFNLQGSNP